MKNLIFTYIFMNYFNSKGPMRSDMIEHSLQNIIV